MECMKALKRWDAADLGQGHLQAGTRLHFKNRSEVLERLRRRADPLPPDLANDWSFFLKHWDRWKVGSMPDHRRDSWGIRFLNMMKELSEKMASAQAEGRGHPFADWMRSEMRQPSFCYADLRC